MGGVQTVVVYTQRVKVMGGGPCSRRCHVGTPVGRTRLFQQMVNPELTGNQSDLISIGTTQAKVADSHIQEVCLAFGEIQEM